MKERFTILDIRAIVNELKEVVVNKYIQNIYSSTQKIFYFRLSNKDLFIIESGARIHLTTTYETQINHFCRKLRDNIKNHKIYDVYQYGWDRIVVFDLGRYRLVCEFFSQGNICIVDKEDRIVDVLRQINQLNVKKGEKYIWNKVNFSFETINTLPFEPYFIEKIKEEILASKILNENDKDISNITISENKELKGYFDNLELYLEEIKGSGQILFKGGKPSLLIPYKYSKKTFKVEDELKASVSGNSHKPKDSPLISPLLNNSTIADFVRNKKKYDLQFNSFNQAANYYFYKPKKNKGLKGTKSDRIRARQQQYVEDLELQCESIQDKINFIEENKKFFTSILEIFSHAYDGSMSWNEFDEFYEQSVSEGNTYSESILDYNLKEKKATIKAESAEDAPITLDLSLNVNKNVQSFYKLKKKLQMKGIKTKAVMENFKEAEDKVSKIKTTRPIHWFEKFNYFIYEETLILSGKSAQQNEILVKKHLEQNDVYLHCDVHGGSSVILKEFYKTGVNDVNSDLILRNAAVVALVMSKCWENSIVKEVFWVNSDQVSKTAPSGESISKGGFMIRGTKNFLYPHRLEYGVALVFKMEDSNSFLDFKTRVNEDDVISYAMVVNGPWDILKGYKYSVRIVPGNDKKQKIAKNIFEIFSKLSLGSKEEGFVKGIELQEYINVILMKSRIGKK